MVSLIIGHKGSGKTKLLVDRVNAAVEKSNGNVICVEKETKLTYDVNYRARLVAADSFSVSGFDSLYVSLAVFAPVTMILQTSLLTLPLE